MKRIAFVSTTDVSNRTAGKFMDLEDESSLRRNTMFDTVPNKGFYNGNKIPLDNAP